MWLIDKEHSIYNMINAAVPKFLMKNVRLVRSTVVGMRRAVSETSRYYRVVEILPAISTQTEQISTHEQFSLTLKNSAVLADSSAACFMLLYLGSEPGWQFLQSFSIFVFTGFIVTSLLFLANIQSTFSLLMKMIARSSGEMKYAVAGHFLIALFFLLLCVVYTAAYAFVPLSFAAVLAIPPFFFAIISLFLTFQTVEAHGARL